MISGNLPITLYKVNEEGWVYHILHKCIKYKKALFLSVFFKLKFVMPKIQIFRIFISFF